MTTPLVLITIDDLRAVIREELGLHREAVTASKPKPQRLTVRAAAEEYNIPEYVLRNRIFAGKVPVHRDGRMVYFIRREFEEWIEGGNEG